MACSSGSYRRSTFPEPRRFDGATACSFTRTVCSKRPQGGRVFRRRTLSRHDRAECGQIRCGTRPLHPRGNDPLVRKSCWIRRRCNAHCRRSAVKSPPSLSPRHCSSSQGSAVRGRAQDSSTDSPANRRRRPRLERLGPNRSCVTPIWRPVRRQTQRDYRYRS